MFPEIWLLGANNCYASVNAAASTAFWLCLTIPGNNPLGSIFLGTCSVAGVSGVTPPLGGTAAVHLQGRLPAGQRWIERQLLWPHSH